MLTGYMVEKNVTKREQGEVGAGVRKKIVMHRGSATGDDGVLARMSAGDDQVGENYRSMETEARTWFVGHNSAVREDAPGQ